MSVPITFPANPTLNQVYTNAQNKNWRWNGTVWKSIYKLRATRPDLFVCTVDTDYGIGIVKLGKQECCDFNNSFYEYREFEKNKKEHLNLISIEEFNNIF